MSYRPLCCPKCGNELMPTNQVRELTQQTYKTDSVGTAVALISCEKCHTLWGFVVASDRKSWTIISVLPEDLQMLHKAIRNLMRLGIPVTEITQRIQKQLVVKTRNPSDTPVH
jgi:methylaspartate ammonia-lyase